MDTLKQVKEADVSLVPGRHYLFYLLRPGMKQETLQVELVSTRVQKDGSMGVPRPVRVGADYHYGHFHLPEYVQASDKPIVHLLKALEKEHHQRLLKGTLGYTALEKMLESGRCCLKTLSSPLKRSHTSRSLRFDWLKVKGGYQLQPHLDPEGEIIATDPPCWLDAESGEIGPLEDDVLEGLPLEQILETPILPDAEVSRFTTALLIDHPDLPIPPPVPVAIEEIDAEFLVPHLQLERVEKGEFPYRLKLGFDYGAVSVTAGGGRAVTVLRGVGGLMRLHRDLEAEVTAATRLHQAGFQPDDEVACFVPETDAAVVWKRFLNEIVPQLEAEGWRVTQATDFHPHFIDGGEWVAEIEESEEGWFDLRFDLDLDGQRMPLLPILVPVLQRYTHQDLPVELNVPLGQQRYLTLNSTWLKPFLETVYELFDTEAGDSVRLSRFDAARLAELEEDASLRMKGAEHLRRLGRRLKDFRGLAPVVSPNGLNCQLREYQGFGLSWLQFLREYQLGGILADDMGLGKTVQTLAHLLVEKEAGRLDRPALVVAPTSLMGNWRREAQRFAPDLCVLVLHGPQRCKRFTDVPDHDLVLTTYPLLTRDEEALRKQAWSFVILDEAQTVKNPQSKAARVVRRLDTRHKACLTGTPLENHLGELWAQFDFLMPGFLGDAEQFRRLYRTPIEKHGDEDCRRRLVRRVAPFLLRRTKSEVEQDLPPKTEIVRTVELHSRQASVYESIRVAMEEKVREAVASRGLARSQITILDALLKLRQVCCDPRLLKLTQAHQAPSAKLDLLLAMLPELLQEGRQVLLFSQFTTMLGLIEQALKSSGMSYAKLTGQTRKRDEAIERFKRGEVSLFLISLKAGGMGLNLTEADTVILYDPWWNPAVEVQAMDRAHRIGQDKPVFVYKLLTENTVEEKILRLQAKKKALAEGIYGKARRSASALSADDLRELFAPLG